MKTHRRAPTPRTNERNGAVGANAGGDKAILLAAFGKIDVVALAVALGCAGACIVFLAALALLVKGAPPGVAVGPHLALLGAWLPGFSVTLTGAVLGALYGAILGVVAGGLIAAIWNFTHRLYIVLVAIRAHWWRMMAE